MSSQNWFQAFHKHWPLPDNYVAVDCETSGLSARNDYLCTFGFAIVANRKVHSTGYIVVNWFLDDKLDAPAFESDLIKVADRMREQGKNFHHTAGYLRQFGMAPQVGLQMMLKVLLDARAANYPLVGFNAYNFDSEFIQAHCHDFLQHDYMVGDNEMYDLGMMEKAAQLGPDDQPLPLAGESKRAWSFRIGKLRRKGVLWNLDRYCVPRYGLVQKHNLQHDLSHRSDYDAMCLHHLLEAQRGVGLASMRIVGVDPGSERSAFVLLVDEQPVEHGWILKQ
jgi:DNA polymerase III epsilon subunit-like protein